MATQLTITPDFANKTARLEGNIAVGEKVSLLVVGVDSEEHTNLRVRIRYDGVEVARFPFATGDAWTSADDNASGTIDLNTVELRAVFEGMDDFAKLPCSMLIECNGDVDALYAVASVQIRNWAAIPGDQTPVVIGEWADALAEVEEEMDVLQAALEPLQSFLTHTHDGEAGEIIDHDNLNNSGAYGHDEIDAKLDAHDVTLAAISGQVTAHVDHTMNPHSVTAAQVGLGNVENTADLDKPISTATQAALDEKLEAADLAAHTVLTNNPHLVTKAQVGLGNVDNTSDAAKPVSDATAAAIALHANSESDPHGTLNTLGQLFADVDAATATLAELRAGFAQVVGILKGLSA
jgi:hypothetical protein